MTVRAFPSIAVAMVVQAWVSLTACGLDQEYTGLGERSTRTPGQGECACQSDETGGAGGADNGVLNVENLEGRLYRFTRVALTSPFSGAIGKALNDFFATEIDDNALHILLQVKAHVGSQLLFDVGNGTAAGDEYRLGSTSPLTCSIDGATFDTTGAARLDFPVAEGLLDPPVLPIKRLKLRGKLDPDGASIGDGALLGALTQEDAKAIKVLGADMATFLQGLAISPDLDLDGDSENDAYEFAGTFTAARVTGQASN